MFLPATAEAFAIIPAKPAMSSERDSASNPGGDEVPETLVGGWQGFPECPTRAARPVHAHSDHSKLSGIAWLSGI